MFFQTVINVIMLSIGGQGRLWMILKVTDT